MYQVQCVRGHWMQVPVEGVGDRLLCPACHTFLTVIGDPPEPRYEFQCKKGHVLRVKAKDGTESERLGVYLTVKGFKPAAVVDAATLTGAMVIALGHVTTGVFANDDKLANELVGAGQVANGLSAASSPSCFCSTTSRSKFIWRRLEIGCGKRRCRSTFATGPWS